MRIRTAVRGKPHRDTRCVQAVQHHQAQDRALAAEGVPKGSLYISIEGYRFLIIAIHMARHMQAYLSSRAPPASVSFLYRMSSTTISAMAILEVNPGLSIPINVIIGFNLSFP